MKPPHAVPSQMDSMQDAFIGSRYPKHESPVATLGAHQVSRLIANAGPSSIRQKEMGGSQTL